LLKKPAVGGTPTIDRAATTNAGHEQRHPPAEPGEAVDLLEPGLRPGRRRQRGTGSLHEGVVQHVQQRAGQREGVGQADAQADVPELGDGAVREQALEVALRDGAQTDPRRCRRRRTTRAAS
jgi:hypothetical protein